jgi:uncharacterized membrane protein HdeD (DUF308 family)
VAGILFGIACFASTGIAGLFLVLLLAADLLIDGLFAAAGGAMVRSWWLVVEGVIGIVAGIRASFFPTITALALVLLVSAWAFLTGIAELATAVLLRRYAGLITIVWLMGSYAFLVGVLFPRWRSGCGAERRPLWLPRHEVAGAPARPINSR